jgi:hypothetical protein
MASCQAVFCPGSQDVNVTNCVFTLVLTLHIQELDLTVNRAARTSHATCTPASNWSAHRSRRR